MNPKIAETLALAMSIAGAILIAISIEFSDPGSAAGARRERSKIERLLTLTARRPRLFHLGWALIVLGFAIQLLLIWV